MFSKQSKPLHISKYTKPVLQHIITINKAMRRYSMKSIQITFRNGTNEDWDQACDIILECASIINRANLTQHARSIVLSSLAALAKDQEEQFEKQSLGIHNDD